MTFASLQHARASRQAGKTGRAYRWRTALLATSIALSTVPLLPMPVFAQATVSYSIPAGRLDTALTRFGATSGVQLLYSSSVTRGLSTQGVSGALAPQDALQQLLAGTGLSYRFTAANSATIGTTTAAAGADAQGTTVLDTITVSGGTGRALADAPFETAGSSAFIGTEQIERVQTGRGSDLLKTTPGVLSANGNNGTSMNVNIRGMQGMNRVNTTVDGAQQSFTTYRGYMGVDSRTYVDPDFIGGISIAKGPGADATSAGFIGGSVSMRTISADDIVMDGKNHGVRLRGGFADNTIAPLGRNTVGQRTDGGELFDFESGYGNIVGAWKNENFEFLAAYGRRKSGNYFAGTEGMGGWFTPPTGGGMPLLHQAYTRGGEVPNTSFDTRSALIKGSVIHEDHRLDLSHNFYGSTYGEMWLTDVGRTPIQQRQKPLNSIVSNASRASYSWNPGSQLFDFKANLWSATGNETQYTRGGGTNFNRSEISTQTWGADVSNTSRFSGVWGDLAWTYGASHAMEDTAPNRTTGSVLGVLGTREVNSLFTSARYSPLNWLTLDGGLQYVSYSMTGDGLGTLVDPVTFNPVGTIQSEGSKLSPTASITVEPLDGLQVFAKYAEGFRPPSIRELADPVVTFVNPNLKPEEAKNWEVGLNFSRNDLITAGDELRFKFAYFNNSYDNYIIRGVDQNFGALIADNVDQARFKGIELQASYDSGRFFADAAYTRYNDASFGCPVYATAANCRGGSFNQDYSAFAMPPEQTISVTLGARFLEEKLTLGTRVLRVDERFGGRSYANRTVSWEDYNVVDFFGSYEVSENMEFNFSVDNAFDRFYMDALNTSAMPAPGRTFRASLTAKF